MTPKSFFKFVEIQTKTASLFPYLFALLLVLYRYGSLNIYNGLLMFSSLLTFDMATTGINNLMDYKKSKNPDYRSRVNIVGAAGIGETQAAIHIFILLFIAIALGIALSLSAGIVVLLLGAISFFVGIFYTFGPIPISRTPLGEILSGFLMGFIILYLAVYVHAPSLAALSLEGVVLKININLKETLVLFLLSLPFVLAIANLMLANNICDLEQDINHDRYLLPYYVGMKNSLRIFSASYYGAYISILAAVILRLLPLLSLITLLSLIPVIKNIRLFRRKQIKEETFITAVKNLTIISLSYIIPLALSVIADRFF